MYISHTYINDKSFSEKVRFVLSSKIHRLTFLWRLNLLFYLHYLQCFLPEKPFWERGLGVPVGSLCVHGKITFHTFSSIPVLYLEEAHISVAYFISKVLNVDQNNVFVLEVSDFK